MTTLDDALQYHRQGEWEKAKTLYQQVLTEDPNNIEALHGLAILFAMQQDYIEAKQWIEKAFALDTNNIRLYNSAGNIYLGLEDFEQAKKMYQTAIQLKKDYAPAYNNLGKCYYLLGDYTAAKKEYTIALHYQPASSDYYFNLGLVEIQLNELIAAENAFKKSIEINPKNSMAHFQLAELLINKAPEVAETHLKICLELSPNNGNAWYDLGFIALKKHEIEKAITNFEHAITENSTQDFLHYHLALAYLFKKDYSNALKNFLKQTQINKDFSSYYNAGVILMNQNHYQDALMYFQIALSINPNDLALQINTATLYLKMGKNPEAIHHYEKALVLKPQDKEIEHILAALKKGETPETAPNEYVQHLFDSYAEHFDQHLKEHLSYRVPEQIFNLLKEEKILLEGTSLIALDLGCGTGLMGALIQPYCKTLEGIDISEAMLLQAKNKKIYTDLVTGDIQSVLEKNNKKYDLILAADVFIYMGNLKKIFSLAFDCLHPSGIFVFTVEKSEIFPYQLQESIRYSHHKDYIVSLCSDNQFICLKSEEIILRKEYKKNVTGYLFLMKKEVH